MSFFKILVIGEVATGKTSFVNQFVNKTFEQTYKATIGCEFGLKVCEINGQAIRIQMWDIAGQDRLGGISKVFCRNAKGALILCDITRPETLEQVIKWKEQVEDIMGEEKIPMILCGNKSDLLSVEQLSQQSSFLKQHAKKSSMIDAYVTSAKTGHNVNEAVQKLISTILQKQQEVGTQQNNTENLAEAFKIEKQKSQTKKKQSCCS